MPGNSLITSWVHFYKSIPHSFRSEAIILCVYSSPDEQGMLNGSALLEWVNSVSVPCVYYLHWITKTLRDLRIMFSIFQHVCFIDILFCVDKSCVWNFLFYIFTTITALLLIKKLFDGYVVKCRKISSIVNLLKFWTYI